MEVRIVNESWASFDDLLALVYDVLYRGYDVPEHADWHRPASAEGPIFAAVIGSEIVGTVRLVGAWEDGRAQVRQLAVHPRVRRTGVGRVLVAAIEEHARENGASEVWLYARDIAFPFYERLGYTYTGGTFVSELTGIPHRPMHKVL